MPPAATLGSRAGLVNKCNRWSPKAAPDQQLRSFSEGQPLLLLGSRGRSTRTFQQGDFGNANCPGGARTGSFSEDPTANTTEAITPSTAAHPDFAYSTSLALCGASADAMGFAHQSR